MIGNTNVENAVVSDEERAGDKISGIAVMTNVLTKLRMSFSGSTLDRRLAVIRRF
jgi:hypothetical protein